MKTAQLSDDTTTIDLPPLEVPFSTEQVPSESKVQTADNNISVYFDPEKRRWIASWRYLSEEQYNDIVGFYHRRRTHFKFPLLTIPEDNVINVPVDIEVSPKRIIDDCGTVGDFSITLRETRN